MHAMTSYLVFVDFVTTEGGKASCSPNNERGVKVAQRGLQEYSDAEFNSMQTGMFCLNYYYCYKVVIIKKFCIHNRKS